MLGSILIFILLHLVCPVFPASLIAEAVFSPLYILTSFVKHKMPIGMQVYLWAFCLVPLGIFVPYHSILITVALQYSLKWGRLIPPAPSLFLKICLAIQCLLCFHENCKSFCSSSVKNVIGNMMGTALNPKVALGSTVSLTMLVLPNQKHGISLHLFMSLISFIHVL